jgi:hypothetical protein
MNKPVKPEQLELEAAETLAQELIDGALEKRRSPLITASDPADRFDWDKDADCVILKEQPATAIYHGGGGHVVIRQTNGLEEDVTILIAPENANRFMDGIADFLRKK